MFIFEKRFFSIFYTWVNFGPLKNWNLGDRKKGTQIKNVFLHFILHYFATFENIPLVDIKKIPIPTLLHLCILHNFKTEFYKYLL